MDTFLVTGLPRSRLFWLSRFLTVPHHSLCTCDAVGHAQSAEDFWARGEQLARERGLRYYGNCERLNLPLLPSLLAARPLTRVVYIERDLAGSMDAASHAGQGIPQSIWAALDHYRQSYSHLFDARVPFHSLDDSTAMKNLWQVLLPSLPWKEARFAAFKRAKILCQKSTLSVSDFKDLKTFLAREVHTPFLEI